MKNKHKNGNATDSIFLGKHNSYLSAMKGQRSVRYRYLYALGKGDLKAGYSIYAEHAEYLKKEFIDIYQIEGKRNFIDWIYERGFYDNWYGAYLLIHQRIYTTKTLRVELVRKMRKILKLYRIENGIEVPTS
jgi:hypothetical protein